MKIQLLVKTLKKRCQIPSLIEMKVGKGINAMRYPGDKPVTGG
jgi:hypothetical protein